MPVACRLGVIPGMKRATRAYPLRPGPGALPPFSCFVLPTISRGKAVGMRGVPLLVNNDPGAWGTGSSERPGKSPFLAKKKAAS